MQNKLILTDLDDVVLKWTDRFVVWVHGYLGLNPSTSLSDHDNIEEWLDLPYSETHKFIQEFNESNWFMDLEPYNDALEYIPKISDKGYSFVAITACKDDNWTHQARTKNLARYFGSIFSTVHCVGLSQSKRRELSWYRPAIWIEDKPSNAQAGFQEGHKAYLINRPRNVRHQVDDVIRIDGWKTIYEELE